MPSRGCSRTKASNISCAIRAISHRSLRRGRNPPDRLPARAGRRGDRRRHQPLDQRQADRRLRAAGRTGDRELVLRRRAIVQRRHPDARLCPGPAPMGRSHTPPHFSAVDNFAHITKWACELDDAGRVWELMRRAFHNLRSGRTGPVLIEMTGDITEAECGEYAYRPVRAVRSAPDPADIRPPPTYCSPRSGPVIQAGQGDPLRRRDGDELVRVAELLQAPVLTTNPGKSGFPEDHPLALGAMVNSAPKTAFAFLKDADCVFGAGTSLSRVNWAPKIPPGKRMVHLTNDPIDIKRTTSSTRRSSPTRSSRCKRSPTRSSRASTCGARCRSRGRARCARVGSRVGAGTHVVGAADQPVSHDPRASRRCCRTAHDRHPRGRQPARADGPVLAEPHAARLPRLGEVDVARARGSA